MNHTIRTSSRCGVVLAAGEGKRLQPFIQRLRGDALPKQYVNFIGHQSLLDHTFSRAERLIDPEQLFTVVSQDHLKFPEVARQLANRATGTVVVQPENRETAPGLLLPLIHLCKRYPNATVVVFPSDHFIPDETPLITYVDQAFRIVERDSRYLVLLGVEPDRPETDYGYILPGGEVNRLLPLPAREVLHFVEKPDIQTAGEIILRGGLWNTMIMVFRAKTLIERMCQISPRLHSFFREIREVIGTLRETEVVTKAYRLMEAMNFSREILEAFSPPREFGLLVLPVRGVVWSDWGSEERITRAVTIGEHLKQIHDGQGPIQVLREKESPFDAGRRSEDYGQ
ncbi:MAG: sugar phosphate nucleotidyltransferase [Candidatus Binatia bacterium]